MGKQQKKDLTGQRFGRWTVLPQVEAVHRYERKWLCRCDCGTERFVLENNLLSGDSRSCGCLRKERAMDLQGKTFGQLTVLKRAAVQKKNGGRYWLCRCSCGNEYVVSGTLLVTGKRTQCPNHRKNYAYKDITGQRFHRLTVLYPAENQHVRGMNWHCRCDCGNEVDLSYNLLMYSNVQSCGCLKQEADQRLHTFLTHVDGTSINALRSQKVPSSNRTGYKGVYRVRGKYMAKIVFQKKQYCLGTYENTEDAVQARKRGEELLFQQAVQLYEAWKCRADADPQWAEQHPFHLEVSRDGNHELQLKSSG